jgi:hypothetical protein
MGAASYLEIRMPRNSLGCWSVGKEKVLGDRSCISDFRPVTASPWPDFSTSFFPFGCALGRVGDNLGLPVANRDPNSPADLSSNGSPKETTFFLSMSLNSPCRFSWASSFKSPASSLPYACMLYLTSFMYESYSPLIGIFVPIELL